MPADSALKRRRLRDRLRYNRKHDAHRASVARIVEAGLALCARCGEPILPGEPWDLGHDDRFPHLYSGPEHASCNRGAPNRNVTSRQW